MKISVIIPVYNAEKYVRQAVESALRLDSVFEVILIEDKSPDDALEVCKTLEKEYDKVRLYQHPDKCNHGAGASRNLGIEKSTGDFVAFLDADDFYLPNRFDAEKKLFKNPEVHGVYGALGTHYYSDKAVEQYYPVYGERLVTVYKNHEPQNVFPGQIGLRGSFGLFSIDCLTIRKSALLKMDPWMKPNLRLHQDTEFLFRLSYYANLYPGILDQPVAMRGIHESNRISKVDSGKVKPSASRVLLWMEVQKWADKEPKFPIEYKNHIRRMHRSFQIANASLLKKWKMIISDLFTDPVGIRSGLYNINFRKDLF